MSSWSDIQYMLTKPDIGVEKFVTGLKSVYVNGKVKSWIFDAIDADQFDSAAISDRHADPVYEFSKFFGQFVGDSHAEFLTHCPAPTPLFSRLCGFSCEGELTNLLCVGGAYGNFGERILAARELSTGCMRSLFGEELYRVRSFVSYDSWCSWFRGSGWDVTIFSVDHFKRRWWVLCATDFD